MTIENCPRCGAAAEGNFCGSCGAVLAARHCVECGSQLSEGARFCTQCGTGATPGRAPAAPKPGAASGGGDTHVAWWFAGGLLVLLIMVVAWPVIRPEQSAAPTPPTGPAAIDLSTMTPREAADRLHSRVTEAAEAGDSAQVAQFAPMAVMAYDQARPLDPHGLYDMAAMQQLGGDLSGARATVEEGLEPAPRHLLLLHIGAQVAEELGDLSTASSYYQRILDAYDEEMASGNLDYEAHTRMMSTVRADAVAFLGANPAGADR